MDREYFCMLTIEVKKKGVVEKRVVDEVIDADPDRTDVRGLYYITRDVVLRDLRRYEDLGPEDFTITGFSFYPNQLPR